MNSLSRLHKWSTNKSPMQKLSFWTTGISHCFFCLVNECWKQDFYFDSTEIQASAETQKLSFSIFISLVSLFSLINENQTCLLLYIQFAAIQIHVIFMLYSLCTVCEMRKYDSQFTQTYQITECSYSVFTFFTYFSVKNTITTLR